MTARANRNPSADANTSSTRMKAPAYAESLLRSMNDLRGESGELCDFTILAEGHTFQVHKSILAASSDYFKVMFKGTMRESRQDYIDLKGLPHQAVSAVIDFIYTGDVTLNQEILTSLLDAASHLQVRTLLDLCTQYLNSMLTFDNADELLEIADTYCMYDVLKHFDDLVLEHFEEFAETELFLNLKTDHFIKYVRSDHLKVSSELALFQLVVLWIEEDDDRLVHLDDVVKHVRFALMSEPELHKVAETETARNNANIQQYIQEGQNYHIQGKTGHIQTSERSRVRMPRSSLVFIHPGSSYAPLKISGFCDVDQKFYCLASEDFCGNVNAEITVLDNFIYICRVLDYRNEGGIIKSSLCRFDPRHLTLQELQAFEGPRTESALVGFNKKLYLIGGNINEFVTLNSMCVYDVERNAWADGAELPFPLHSHAACVSHGRIFISGGWSTRNNVPPSALFMCFDPNVGKWESKPPLFVGRRLHSMVPVNDRIFVFGGIGHQRSVQSDPSLIPIEVYDVNSRQWTVLSSTVKGRSDGHFTYINGRIMAIGHEYMSAGEDEIWKYDPDDEKWTKVVKSPNMAFGSCKCVVAVVNFNDQKVVQKIVQKR